MKVLASATNSVLVVVDATAQIVDYLHKAVASMAA